MDDFRPLKHFRRSDGHDAVSSWTHSVTAGQRNVFDDVPDEIIWYIIRFLDTSTQITAGDVCKRFRNAVNRIQKSFGMEMMPSNKRPESAAGIMVRFSNLCQLDLTHGSCLSFMQKNTDIVQFGTSLAAGCPLIQRFSVTGQRGARLFRVYVLSLGPKTRVQRLFLDIERAAIGCALPLTSVSKFLSLTHLSLTTGRTVRRSSRTRSVLSDLFSQLLPGVSFLTLAFSHMDQDFVSDAVSHASGLLFFSANHIQADDLLLLSHRNPGIRTLKVPVTTESVKHLPLFGMLNKLSVRILADDDGELEEQVERAFGTEPLQSRLKVLSVSGFLSNDPVRIFSRLRNLETLLVDRNIPLTHETDDNSFKSMSRLLHLIIRCDFTIPSVCPPVEDQEKSAKQITSTFPVLENVRYQNGEIRVKENFTFWQIESSVPDEDVLFSPDSVSMD